MKSTRTMFVPADTNSTESLSETGPLAAGVPGELAALDFAVKECGTMQLAELLEGAIALADTGFIVNSRYERNLASVAERIGRFPETRRIYFKSDSVPKMSGDRMVLSDLAATLRRIQSQGVNDFYHGEIAANIAKYCEQAGGMISERDLASYQVQIREPVRGSYHGLEIISMPPPSSGGIHVIQILNLLERFDLNSMGAGSSRAIHTIAEAMQIAFADRVEFLADPGFVEVPTWGLVSEEYAADRLSVLDTMKHRPIAAHGDPWKFDSTAGKHTTHLCVVDSMGNAVSLTATINTPFGCGAVVPGTGILLNNEMDDFVTWPGRPNYYGLIGKLANEIEPGKRPLSSMSPTIILRDGDVYMLSGSQGGPRIITSVVLAILNAVEFKMDLQTAVDYPRFHQQWVPDKLFLEPEHPRDVVQALEARGHSIDNKSRWSTVTAIMADTLRGGWWGAADNRAIGSARGE